MIEILLIAAGLAMDAFAVSISCGVSVRGFGRRQAVKMGCWFGFFQFVMPLLGWLLGSSVSGYIRAFDHWIAFGLLALIGGGMAAEALREPGGAEAAAPSRLTARRLAVLALATSIDALAAGVSLAFAGLTLLPAGPDWANILLAAGIIGAVAFVLSVVGGMLGRRLGRVFQRRAALAGGGALIAIGVKILVEHLAGG